MYFRAHGDVCRKRPYRSHIVECDDKPSVQSKLASQFFILRLMAYGLFKTGVLSAAKQFGCYIFSIFESGCRFFVKIQQQTASYVFSVLSACKLGHQQFLL